MVQANSPANNKDALQREGDPEPPEVYRPRTWPMVVIVLGLLTVGAAGVGALIKASAAIADTAVALNFIAQNTLSLFVLLAVVAQACVYWGQRNLMLEQWKAMRDGLAHSEHRPTEHYAASDADYGKSS